MLRRQLETEFGKTFKILSRQDTFQRRALVAIRALRQFYDDEPIEGANVRTSENEADDTLQRELDGLTNKRRFNKDPSEEMRRILGAYFDTHTEHERERDEAFVALEGVIG